jgi:glycosyltransferase involved in cell wall biosynthesis
MTSVTGASCARETRPRLFIVSPFVDKQHGTERRVAEWISRLADDFEIHIYSQRLDDIDTRKFIWHRIPKLLGPHLLNYLWWFVANHVCRRWHARFGGIRPDLVFSPGINCLDADIVSVHVVFAEYLKRFEQDLRLSKAPILAWPYLIHRKLYYRLISLIESRVYRRPETVLVLIAQRTGCELRQHFHRTGPFPVIYVGIDSEVFNPVSRKALRDAARRELGYSDDRFVLLMIGNDWRNKGLPTLIEAVDLLSEFPIDILAVGQDNPRGYDETVRAKGLQERVKFRSPRTDVESYYAAADAYIGASIEDTFAQPPAEAMACGLPVVVSSTNGASEIITDGVDGLILRDGQDAVSLSRMIRQLYEGTNLRARLAANAVRTAQQYTWERNARELRALFEQSLKRKGRPAMGNVTESV